jgi:RHS repeat-associated protein
VTDPDRGTTDYTYNAFGELVRSVDANQRSYSYASRFQYDVYGRRIRRDDQDGTTEWTWDTSPSGLGKLATSVGNAPGATEGVRKVYFYDNFSRPAGIATIDPLAGTGLAAAFAYDTAGRLSQVSYPVYGPAFSVTNEYDSHGNWFKVSNSSTGKVYWQADHADPSGRITQFRTGDGTTTTRAFDDTKDGALTSILTTNTSSPTQKLQDLQYTYDAVRNLKTRKDNLQSGAPTESFCYDALKRITHSGVNVSNPCTGGTVHYTYADNGNLLTKSDLGPGTYQYDVNHPHAVSAAPGGRSFSHDAKGNAVTRWNPSTQTPNYIYYTAFDKPYYEEDDYGWFRYMVYDADGRRVHKDAYSGNSSDLTTTVYIENLYELSYSWITQGLSLKHFVHSPVGVVAVASDTYTLLASGQYSLSQDTKYIHSDNLGSVDVVVNGDLASGGSVAEHRSYTAFGSRRNPSWTASSGPLAASTVPQDYTGHEGDEEAGLVNMNARLYDTDVGRFLSPDPIVGRPLNGQSWNRYSYVLNNPLRFTDPTGLDGKEILDPAVGAKIQAMQAAGQCRYGYGAECLAKIKAGGKAVGSSQTSTSITKNDPQAGGTQPGKSERQGGGDGRQIGPDPASVARQAGLQMQQSLFQIRAVGPIPSLPTGSEGDQQYRHWQRLVDAGATSAITSDYTEDRFKLTIGIVPLGLGGPAGRLGAAAEGVATIETAAVRFTQSSVSQTLRTGENINDVISALRGPGGEALARGFEPIRIFEGEGGALFTLDNRRLLIFSQAGREVPFVWATQAEVAAESWKFTKTVEQVGGWIIRVK